MLLTLATIISLVVLGVSGLALLYVLSKTNYYGTQVETGGFKCLVKGESLCKVLDNLPGGEGYVDQDTHKVVSAGGRRRKIQTLERWFGIIWISIFWPIKKVHRFEVVADKMKSSDQTATIDTPIRERVETRLKETDYLRYRFSHPLVIPGIELGGDLWKVDVVIMADIEVVNPAVVIFSYKGQVLRQVDAAISLAVSNFWRDPRFNYPKFVSEDKGIHSAFAKEILDLNGETSARPEPDGLEDRYGVRLATVCISAYDLSPEQKTFDDAAKAVDKQRLLADAEVQRARGLAAIEEAKRKGIGLGYKEILKSLAEAGLTPDQAAEVLKIDVRMSNVSGSNLTTYVEGGAGVQATIPLNQRG